MAGVQFEWKDLCMRVLHGVEEAEGVWFEENWASDPKELHVVRLVYDDWLRKAHPAEWARVDAKRRRHHEFQNDRRSPDFRGDFIAWLRKHHPDEWEAGWGGLPAAGVKLTDEARRAIARSVVQEPSGTSQ